MWRHKSTFVIYVFFRGFFTHFYSQPSFLDIFLWRHTWHFPALFYKALCFSPLVHRYFFSFYLKSKKNSYYAYKTTARSRVFHESETLLNIFTGAVKFNSCAQNPDTRKSNKSPPQIFNNLKFNLIHKKGSRSQTSTNYNKQKREKIKKTFS